MKLADIVVGANFGDEGKGLVTDYLASKGASTAVLRFNGGAQAGHTVTLSSGERHVFNSFGAGSLRGIPTILSSFFIVNPMMIFKEAADLFRTNFPETYVDPSALVTTPFDVAINRAVEAFRGRNRHGSCGMGIGETVGRSNFSKYTLTVGELSNKKLLEQKLKLIKDEFVPLRLASLGVDVNKAEVAECLHFEFQDTFINCYIEDCLAFGDFLKIEKTNETLKRFDHVVFEGAQGLQLDQDYGRFPNVTRSNTGIKNVESILQAYEQDVKQTIHYLTRSYLTRHGAGPLKFEMMLPYEITDLTNIDNPYQGTLRFALANVKMMRDAIIHDLKYLKSGSKAKVKVGITCCDQVKDEFLFIDSNGKMTGTDNIYDMFDDVINSITHSVFASFGPSANNIEIVKT